MVNMLSLIAFTELNTEYIGLYNKEIPTEIADRTNFCIPAAVSRLIAKGGIRMLASQDPERFDALERAGFKVERYGDLYHHLHERLGGHYMDTGCSTKIAKGLVCHDVLLALVSCISQG
jgi:hypothetical protein